MTRLELPEYDIVGIRAANPGPFTLSGTNSWIVGRAPAWLVDPGPALDEHLAQGVELRSMKPAELAEFNRIEVEKWSDLVRRSGAQVD